MWVLIGKGKEKKERRKEGRANENEPLTSTNGSNGGGENFVRSRNVCSYSSYSELAHPRIYLKSERKGAAAAAARYSPPGTSTFNAWLKFGYIVTDGLETPSVLMSITAVKDMILAKLRFFIES